MTRGCLPLREAPRRAPSARVQPGGLVARLWMERERESTPRIRNPRTSVTVPEKKPGLTASLDGCWSMPGPSGPGTPALLSLFEGGPLLPGGRRIEWHIPLYASVRARSSCRPASRAPRGRADLRDEEEAQDPDCGALPADDPGAGPREGQPPSDRRPSRVPLPSVGCWGPVGRWWPPTARSSASSRG